MDKLLLVDGSNLLFQMFYGMPARIFNKNGKAIHGTIGFVGALLKILKLTTPTHVAVLFDGEHENERASLNADYKANRIDYTNVQESENPFSQLCDIYAALDHLKIKHAETTTCETDDWMAAYALQFGNTAQVVICSFDSDFFQLITENVSVLRYRGAKTTIFTPNSIQNKFGIDPSQYADFKALVGDASDNIKGAEKIGPKTAAFLLNKYGNLQNVITNAATIERKAVRESVEKNAEKLSTNYKLIKLGGLSNSQTLPQQQETQPNCGATLPFDFDQLNYTFKDCSTMEILKTTTLLP